MVRSKQTDRIRRMVVLAVLTAIVLVLQLTGFAIKIPVLGTPISLVLIPITLGAMLLGPAAGAWLGLVFGLEVYIVCGVMGTDPFTAYLFNDHPLITGILCLAKSTLAGWVSGLVYKALMKKNWIWPAVFLAAAAVPVINTGVFIVGCLLINSTISGFMAASSIAGSVIYFLVIGCAGINFLFEFAVNMILSPALERIVRIAARHFA